jgi:hypothetical protein
MLMLRTANDLTDYDPDKGLKTIVLRKQQCATGGKRKTQRACQVRVELAWVSPPLMAWVPRSSQHEQQRNDDRQRQQAVQQRLPV